MRVGREAAIECPIGLFPRQEAEIGRLTTDINQARTAAQKAPYAQDLIEAVNALLDCVAYDQENLNCRLCRGFSELRHKTATLIIKAGSLNR